MYNYIIVHLKSQLADIGLICRTYQHYRPYITASHCQTPNGYGGKVFGKGKVLRWKRRQK